MTEIPPFVVEHFLLAGERIDSMDRYTQDGGVAFDVWLAFAQLRECRARVLLSAGPEVSTIRLAATLHEKLSASRARHAHADDKRTGVSALDQYAVANVTFHELIHIVLPLTSWWRQYGLSEIQRLPVPDRHLVKEAVIARLSGLPLTTFIGVCEPEQIDLAKRLYDAAPVLALIGVYIAADRGEIEFKELPDGSSKGSLEHGFDKWLLGNVNAIANAFFEELLLRPPPSRPAAARRRRSLFAEKEEEDIALVQRVFRDRAVSLSDAEALGTIKADAATRLFDISCRGITWAVIDAGIDPTHPAFADHDAPASPPGSGPPPSRIRRAFEFTKMELIRGWDLTDGEEHSPQRLAAIEKVINELVAVSGREDSEQFRGMARENLALIANQLKHELNPDWKLIEPLIELKTSDGAGLVSDHGTHVAGILGADWREASNPAAKPKLLGVCPDINLYDLRVLGSSGELFGLESAVISALDFVRYLNAKGPNEPVVAGVNISMSIPYNPGMYGCGVTPVCVASDRLSDSGVVVVAAAGNRGWNQQATSVGNDTVFGQALFSTVTDPGNAHQVITVGSTHRSKPHLYGVSFFSGRGPTADGRLKPDLVAPGEKIRGPVPGPDQRPKDGTSMAAPYVSGAAAMLLARHKELQGHPARVKKILCESATDLGRERYFQGHGLVDVLRAIQSV